jgi:hypothetical protein
MALYTRLRGEKYVNKKQGEKDRDGIIVLRRENVHIRK